MSFRAIRFLLLLGLLLVQSQTRPAISEESLRVATEGTYAPFSFYTPDGKLTGFDVDVARALCEAARLACEFVTLDYEGMVEALQQKKIDAIAAGMSITEKRKKMVAFTESYRSSDKRFVSCGAQPITDISPEALKSRVIGTQAGTSSVDYMKAHYAGSDIRLYKSMDEAFQDLGAGRLDLALATEPVGYAFMTTPSGKNCAFAGPRIKDEKLFGQGVGIAFRKEDTALVERFNAALSAIRASGTFAAINKRYFPFPVD
jgi:lysine-arginine-ornithine-binding protein